MRTIALINQKGGCGKTTCSINLAACLAQLNQRTLLVDIDPQGHCAVGLAVPESQIERSIYDVLRDGSGKTSIKDVVWQIATNFDLAPSNIALAALEPELHDLPGRQDRLSDALTRASLQYDYCVIDCPPNVGLLTFNALRACQEVVIPVETGYFSLHGLSKQIELLDTLRKQCRQDIRVRVLATLYDIRTKLAREVLAELRQQFGELMLESTINFNTKLKEATSFGQPITEYDPGSKGCKDFHKLARELMGPPPRITLDLSKFQTEGVLARVGAAAEKAVAEEESAAPVALAPQQEEIPEGIELAEAEEHDALEPAVVSSAAAQAEALLKRADDLMASVKRDLGVGCAPSKRTTEQKINDFYGVRQMPEGVLFVAKFPKAQDVRIAGDFNNWVPEKTPMLHADGPDTFRALIRLEPGRYRYRLVVDGQWQTDPNNQAYEPNPFGGMNSVVEVV